MSSRWIKMSRSEAMLLAPYCQYYNPSRKTCYVTCQSQNCQHSTCCVYCHEYDSCPHGIFCPTFEKRAIYPETRTTNHPILLHNNHALHGNHTLTENTTNPAI